MLCLGWLALQPSKRSFGIEPLTLHFAMFSPAGGKEVQLDLPVFCISSRDAHKLEGRFRSEKGCIFSSLLHTEVLQLRQHVHSLTGEHSARFHSGLPHWLSLQYELRRVASRQSSTLSITQLHVICSSFQILTAS